ncbi:MAG: DUF4388 domain-containing protein [Desulfobulbaceae bacterium]|nr:DUF4388 domain-containing protein [Desulfobulbaceae bacterium]
MAQTIEIQGEGHGGGVSLASFMQLLEYESKSCTLKVVSGRISGSFFFEEGNLIDAECGEATGEDAVYDLLALDKPAFKVGDADDRMQRITRPLTHFLLNAATKRDEKQQDNGAGNMQNDARGTANVQGNPAVEKLIETIVRIGGVKHYYLLNRQGKMITQSSRNQKIGDFIAYSIVCGIQMRKSLDVKGPHRIRLVLDNGEVLLIMPGAGMIIAVLLDEETSTSEVAAKLRDTLSQKME